MQSLTPASRRHRLAWAALLGAVLLAVLLVTVTVTGPRVSVRWRADIGPVARVALEARHGLRNGRQDNPGQPLVWWSEFADWSQDAVAALVRDDAVADTNYIDRSTYQVGDPAVVVSTRIPGLLRALPFRSAPTTASTR